MDGFKAIYRILKALEYLHGNSMMAKAARAAKGIAEVI